MFFPTPQGDAGGPVVSDGSVVALVSMGSSFLGCGTEYPQMHIALDDVMGWINDVTGGRAERADVTGGRA